MRRAFTLVEVLVVMAIVAVLLSIGIVGLIQFRAATEVKESGRQLSGTLDLLKNAAKNDVRPDTGANAINFKGYKYSFTSEQVEYCEEERIDEDTVVQEWLCTYDEAVEETFFTLTFPVIFERGADFDNPDGKEQCIAVYFESLTGDIQIEDTPGNIRTNTDCFVPFTDFSRSQTGYLYIDALTDTYLITPSLENTKRFE